MAEVAVDAILFSGQPADGETIQRAGGLHNRANFRSDWEGLKKARVAGLTMPEALI